MLVQLEIRRKVHEHSLVDELAELILVNSLATRDLVSRRIEVRAMVTANLKLGVARLKPPLFNTGGDYRDPWGWISRVSAP
jgi:hypothetical protein